VLPTLFLSLWRSGQVEKASVAAIIMTLMILVVVTLVRRITGAGLRSAATT
jgi:ABC-type Fe3+ transport system permease subunit